MSTSQMSSVILLMQIVNRVGSGVRPLEEQMVHQRLDTPGTSCSCIGRILFERGRAAGGQAVPERHHTRDYRNTC